MHKFKKLLVTMVLTVTVISFGNTQVQAEDHDKKSFFKEDVNLTEQQRKELDSLYKDVINRRKAIINKYVEFGVIEKEKAEKINKHLDKYYQKVKEDGFIPKWDKHHKEKKHKEDNQ